MRRTVALFALALGAVASFGVACSSGNPGDDPGSMGQLELPLSAVAPSGSTYVLCEGDVLIMGENLGIIIDAGDHIDEPLVTVGLPAGEYDLVVLGWTLCEVEGSDLVPVDAELLNSIDEFEIEPAQPTFVHLQFMVDNQVLAIPGQLVLGIDVIENTGGTGPTGGYGGVGPGGVGPIGGSGGGGNVPPGWECPPEFYADGLCDCLCGAWDPDCDELGDEPYDCGPGEICVYPGVCQSGGWGGMGGAGGDAG